MKRLIVPLILVFFYITQPLAALEVPALKGHINDYAKMFSPGTVSKLEKELADFEKSDSTQIVVLTITSLKGEVVEEYSMKVAEKWKIGQNKLDNGVIVLISKEDRKIRIEVGYGLEKKLTDLRAGRIIRNTITPQFKSGNYDYGITLGVGAIMMTVRGEYSAADAEPLVQEPAGLGKTQWLMPLVIVGSIFGFIAIMLLLVSILVKKGLIKETGFSAGSSYSSSSSSGGSTSSSSGSSSGSSSSSSSGSYSGGGGGFGGGGASSSW